MKEYTSFHAFLFSKLATTLRGAPWNLIITLNTRHLPDSISNMCDMYHPKKCNTIYQIRSKYVVPVISAIPVHDGASNDGQLDCLLNSLFNLKQIKPKSSHYWPYVSGIYSPHKGPIMWKAFPCHHIIVTFLINDHCRVWWCRGII